MNDLTFKQFTPNQPDLERPEQGDKLTAKPEEVDVEDELQFYIYPFTKIEEKLLKVLPTCSCPNFCLKNEFDPQYGRAYVLDVDTKSSAAKLCLSFKATQQAVRLSYIVEIACHCIFTKSEATTALSQTLDEGVCEFHITFTIEPTLTAKQRRHNANELALFDLQIKLEGNELPTNDLNGVNTDFSSSNLITITDNCAQSRFNPYTARFSLFQDVGRH